MVNLAMIHSLIAYQKKFETKKKNPPLKTFSQTKGTNSVKYRQLVTSEDDKCSEAKEATARNSKSVREIYWRSSSNYGAGITKPHMSYATVQHLYT